MTEQERRELIQKNQRQREINMKWLPATMALSDKMEETGAYTPTPIYRSPFRSSTPRYSPRSPNRQFEYGQGTSSNKSRTQSINEWLQDFQSNRANIPGQYTLGREPSPRNTFWDDEPSVEALSQIRTMNAIKDADSASAALLAKYNSLNNLNVPLSNEENNMGDIFNIPWRRNEYDYGKGRYDPNAGNRGERTTELFGASKAPSMYVTSGKTPGGPTPYMDRLNYLRGMENPPPKDPGFSLDGGQTSFYSDDAFMQGFRDATGYGGGDVEGTIRDNIRFDLGDRGDGKGDKTDWLGWAGIGTGLLQGAGGIMDYFANMKGLELTKEAMDRKYAADDRNYLAQATALNNVIDTRKDFINKTQGGRNTDFLKNIPV